MLDVRYSTKFKKDFKTCQTRETPPRLCQNSEGGFFLSCNRIFFEPSSMSWRISSVFLTGKRIMILRC